MTWPFWVASPVTSSGWRAPRGGAFGERHSRLPVGPHHSQASTHQWLTPAGASGSAPCQADQLRLCPPRPLSRSLSAQCLQCSSSLGYCLFVPQIIFACPRGSLASLLCVPCSAPHLSLGWVPSSEVLPATVWCPVLGPLSPSDCSNLAPRVVVSSTQGICSSAGKGSHPSFSSRGWHTSWPTVFWKNEGPTQVL